MDDAKPYVKAVVKPGRTWINLASSLHSLHEQLRQSIVCQSEGDTRELWEWTDLYTLDLTKLMIGVLSQEDLLKINEVIRMKRKAAL